jgi:hypothetical protein
MWFRKVKRSLFNFLVVLPKGGTTNKHLASKTCRFFVKQFFSRLGEATVKNTHILYQKTLDKVFYTLGQFLILRPSF